MNNPKPAERSRQVMEAKGWKLVGAPGVLRYVHKSIIFVDHEYQRDLEINKTKKIAAEWNWGALGALTLARRNKVLYVVDGQHRLHAANMREDIQKLPCIIFDSTGVEKEADDFVSIQKNRMPMRSWDTYRAMIAAGDEKALELEKLIHSCGRQISRHNNQGSIRCVARLMEQIAQNKPVLERLLPLMINVTIGRQFHERIVGALFYTEINLPEGISLTDKRWTKRILEIGYDEILASIARSAAYYSRGSDRVFSIGLVNAINSGLRNRLPIYQEEGAL